MKAIVFEKIGPPQEVLELREIPVPEIKDNEVLVRMLAASINPGDFLFIENLYPEPKKPRFPQQIAGNHGAGIIEKVGKNVSLTPGTLVAFSYYNSWAEYAAVLEEWLIPLPANYPIEKAAQFVNPITAWDLLTESHVPSGQWLALTAGNSSVATMVLQMAKHRDIPVISIVRQAQKDLDLKALGAAEVIELSRPEKLEKSVGERVQEITQGRGVRGIIDCLGGPVLGELIQNTDFGAQVIIYGGMSTEKFSLHNFDVLLKDIGIRAYVYRYFFTPPKPEDAETLREIAAISAPADFHIHAGGMHPLEDFKTALHETLNFPERGKRFLKMAG